MDTRARMHTHTHTHTETTQGKLSQKEYYREGSGRLWGGRNGPEVSLGGFRRTQEVSREGSSVSSSVECWAPGESGCGSGGTAMTIEEAGGKCCCEKGRKACSGGQSPKKHGEQRLILGPELFSLTSFDRQAR